MADISQVSDKDLLGFAAEQQISPSIDKVSDKDLLGMAVQPEAQAPSFKQQLETEFEEFKGMRRAAEVGIQRGVSFGARPAIIGAGEAISGGAEALIGGGGLREAIDQGVESFKKGRQEAIQEQAQLQEEFPGTTLASQVAGGVVTLPFTPVRGVVSAARLGAAAAGAEAVGEAETFGEIPKRIVSGAAIGGAIGVAGKALTSRAAKAIVKGAKGAFVRVSEATTGVPRQAIRTFIDRNREVKGLIKRFGDDIPEAADNLRRNLRAEIASTRQRLGSEISNVLQEASPEKNISITPVINKLQELKKRINVKLNPDDASQIDDLVQKVTSVADDNQVSLGELNQIKEFLQDRAKRAYLTGGAIFEPGVKAQQASKQAAALARETLNGLAPQIKQANLKLSTLHQIEDTANRNLLKVGAPERAVLGAGRGEVGREAATLRRLGRVTETEPLVRAQELQAAKQFGAPGLTPLSGAGTTATSRVLSGPGLGGLTGFALGGPKGALLGAAIGGALTSPATLKQVINAGLFSQRLAGKGVKFLASPKGQAAIIKELSERQALENQLSKELNFPK